MAKPQTVFLHVWTGDAQQAAAFARARYPDAELRIIAHRELRGNGWKAQFAALHRLKGRAVVYFLRAPEDNKQPELLVWTQLIHRCRETVVAYADNKAEVYRSADCVRRLPVLLTALACDCLALAWCCLRLKWLAARVQPCCQNTAGQEPGATSLDIAYLYPFPLNRYSAGGAMTHIRGVVGGLVQNGANCAIFSGSDLPVDACAVHLVPRKPRAFLFGEAVMLAYNWTFARAVARLLAPRHPRTLYQRHGRFAISGALLSRYLDVPLILEYNGSETWMSRHWDPTRFGTLLRLAENVSLRAAANIVVVCEASRQELIARGVPAERIVVNPNGVDPEQFRPGCGGAEVREQLGIAPDEVVVSFVGTFSYWHGIETLQQAADKLLRDAANSRLRFVLVGEGPLHAAMQAALHDYVARRRVIFTGLVAHSRVNSYLDAADILLSPHIPMPAGEAHFSSPTKLFEYMAMGKAIVASDIGQLAEILDHMRTALLVTPGEVNDVVSAIQLLAGDSALRARLGQAARAAAIAHHTWKQNAARVLALIKEKPTTDLNRLRRIGKASACASDLP